MSKQTVPIEKHVCEGGRRDSNSRLHLAMADIIWGVDCKSGEGFLVFGRKRLEKIVSSGQAQVSQILLVPVDGREGLEALRAEARAVKGHDD